MITVGFILVAAAAITNVAGNWAAAKKAKKQQDPPSPTQPAPDGNFDER